MIQHQTRHWLRFDPGIGGRLIVGTGRRTSRGWAPQAHEASFDGEAHETEHHDIPLSTGDLAFGNEADAAEYAMKLAVMLVDGSFRSGAVKRRRRRSTRDAANEELFHPVEPSA